MHAALSQPGYNILAYLHVASGLYGADDVLVGCLGCDPASVNDECGIIPRNQLDVPGVYHLRLRIVFRVGSKRYMWIVPRREQHCHAPCSGDLNGQSDQVKSRAWQVHGRVAIGEA